MAKLHLIGITCHSQNDVVSPDEPFIRLEYPPNTFTTQWSANNVNAGDGRVINVADFTFAGSVKIILMEDDTPAGEDTIEEHVVADTLGLGVRVQRFQGDDGDYQLFYQVIA